MNGVWFVIEKCDKWEEFGEGGGDDVFEFFSGNAVKLIREVEKDGSMCGKGVALLGAVDVPFNGKLHGFHNQVGSIGNTDSNKVERE